MFDFSRHLLISAVFAYIIGASTAAIAAAPTQALIYNESLRLEGGARKCTVAIDPENGENTCLKLERTSETGAASDATATWLEYNNKKHERVNYAISGRFSLEYRAYIPEGGALRTQIYGASDGANSELVTFYMSEETGFTVGDQKLFLPCTANKWYSIKTVIDTDNAFAAFYINGELMAVKNNLSKMKFSIPHVNEMTWFRFQIDKDKFQTYVLLDDVKIQSMNGMGGSADITNISLIKDGKETNVLPRGGAALKAAVRGADGSPVRIFAAQYTGGILCGVSSAEAADSGEYEIPVFINEAATRLSCFAWSVPQMCPIAESSFCPEGAPLSEYGAVEKSDIRKLLQDIIDRMQDGEELDLGSGEYIVTPDVGERYCISVNGKKNIKIKGNGAKIILEDPFSGFMKISESSNVTVEGIKLDCKTVPWEQGTVLSVDAESMSFTFRPDSSGGVIDTETFAQNIAESFIMVRDADNPYLIDDSTNEHYLISGFERLENGIYRFSVSGWSESLIKNGLLKSGAKLIVNARGRSGSSFCIESSGDTVLQNIEISASGECAVKGISLTGDITVDNLKIAPGEGQWISSNADGVHIRFSRGRVNIRNCTFEGLCDDAVNLYQPPLEVLSAEDGNISPRDGAALLVPGEKLIVFNYANGKIKGEITVDSVNGNTLTCTDNTAAAGDVLYVKDAMYGGSTIENNVFRNLRRYGLLLKCDGITVSGNIFEKTGSDAVTSVYSSEEGLYLRNARFIGNSVINCGYLRNGRQNNSGAFSIKVQSGAEDMLHSDILFSGNTITGAPVCGFYLENADRVVIDETNVFENGAENATAVNTKNCGSVIIADKLK